MSGSNNFLLKIHMEEDETLTEIYLNKERRSFTFIDDECISDLIIPEFKIASLNMILENLSEAEGSDTYYAEYEKNGKLIREYDREKIRILVNMITKISVNDFIKYQKDIKVNSYYVDNIIDVYNCVLPIEMKKVLSYTTNGVVFNDDVIIYVLPHEDITSYNKKIPDFIPFMMRNGKSYIGYNFKKSLYEEYLETELIKDSDNLEEIIGVEKSPEKEDLIKIDEMGEEEILTEKIDKSNEEFEDAIKNINHQFEKLNSGVIQKEKNGPYNLKSSNEKDKDELTQQEMKDKAKEMDLINKEIRDEVRRSLDEMEKTNVLIDEIDDAIDKMPSKNNQSKSKKEKVVKKNISDRIGREAELVLQKLNVEIAKLEETKQKTKKAQVTISDAIGKEAEKILKKLDTEIDKLEKDSQKNRDFKDTVSDAIGKEAATVLKKLNEEISKFDDNDEKAHKYNAISENVHKEADIILKKLNNEIAKLQDAKRETDKSQIVISDAIGKEADAILKKLNAEIAKIESDKQKSKKPKFIDSDIIRKEAETILAKLNKEIANKTKAKNKNDKEIKNGDKDTLSLNVILNNSINNAFDNYKINFNDTQKLVIEYLPYYEISNNFDVIQIPEIDINKYTLLPNEELDLGKLKLKVEKIHSDCVELSVEKAVSIVDKDGNKLKKGDCIVVNTQTEFDLRLNKKSAMETWSLRMEKSTFEKELRNIDFKKIINSVSQLESYKKLGTIEKYEAQKAIMLFVNFVMENNDENSLTGLYEIIAKQPTVYEEYITKYNNRNSLQLKDALVTYEQKKEYLIKLNYVNGLIDAKWLDYPRYIYNTHNYFEDEKFLEDFISDLNETLSEKDFYDYLMNLFNTYEMFTNLDDVGRDNLEKCIAYLSKLYKYRPDLGEDNKYKIERSFMLGATEEEVSLLIAKLCRHGIKDYSTFVEYDAMMKERYRVGELKYPIYSESFEIEEIRKGGEYDEF